MALLINGQRVAGLGRPGVGIKTIERTKGDGSPGTDDTYTITFDDGRTSGFSVHNGADGTNDMAVEVYDPQGKKQDIFEYADDVAEQAADEVRAEMNSKPNPNLLDNWYFANPVNQRGNTSNRAGYFVDRWFAYAGTGRPDITLSNGALNFTAHGSHIYQKFESIYTDREMTWSVLHADGTLETGKVVVGGYSDSDRLAVYYGSDYGFLVRPRYGSEETVSIKAVKLELGSTQTLAHQDADGNWVLNEIPDYNTELLKCCMSTADSSDTYANNKKTPAVVGALNKAGDTMTGRLKSSLDTSVVAHFFGSDGKAYLQADADTTNFRQLVLAHGDKVTDFNSCFYISDIVNGVVVAKHNILHTGSKPSGSYTGNGDVTARTIETGGVGNMIAIWSVEYGTSLIFKKGVINRVDDKIQGLGAVVTFGEEGVGVLKLTTSSGFVNASGVTYYYQVL